MFDENKRYICNHCEKAASVYLFDKQTNEWITVCNTCYLNKYRGIKYNWLPIVGKYNNEEKFGINGIHIGDTIYVYDPKSNEKYNVRIGEIVITEAGIILKGGFEIQRVICPLNKIDSNKHWNYCLYFSSDEKRSKFIEENYK